MRCYYVSSTCLLFYFTVLLLFFFVNLTLNVHANVPDERSTFKDSSLCDPCNKEMGIKNK